jgi:hypothetical protein
MDFPRFVLPRRRLPSHGRATCYDEGWSCSPVTFVPKTWHSVRRASRHPAGVPNRRSRYPLAGHAEIDRRGNLRARIDHCSACVRRSCGFERPSQNHPRLIAKSGTRTRVFHGHSTPIFRHPHGHPTTKSTMRSSLQIFHVELLGLTGNPGDFSEVWDRDGTKPYNPSSHFFREFLDFVAYAVEKRPSSISV